MYHILYYILGIRDKDDLKFRIWLFKSDFKEGLWIVFAALILMAAVMVLSQILLSL